MSEESCPHCGSGDLQDTPAGVACHSCGCLVNEYDSDADEGLPSSETSASLEALAEYFGLNLWLEHQPGEPKEWAVFGDDGITPGDIVAAGATPEQAVDAARDVLQAMERVTLSAERKKAPSLSAGG